MQAFLVKILIAALLDPRVQALLKQLVVAAAADVEKAVLAKLDTLPTTLLGEAAKPVETLLREIPGSTDDIAARVKQDVSPLLSGLGIDQLAPALAEALKRLLPFPL